MNTPFHRVRAFFSSLTVRLVFSQILVAAIASVIGSLALVLVLVIALRNTDVQQYQGTAVFGMMYWLLGVPDGHPMEPGIFSYGSGFYIVEDGKGGVLFTHGDTQCRAGMKLADCAPDLVDIQAGERFFEVDGTRWVESSVNTITGQRAIARLGIPNAPELYLMLPNAPIYGTGKFTLVVATAMALISLPVGWLLAWLTVRPIARRLNHVMKTSRQFAAGDFSSRVQDHTPDKVGDLGRQFDDMADGLEQNMITLREMAQRNVELAQQVEKTAVQAERIRLSRDLHDAIAQRLFSLSVSTATLPDLINRDQVQGAQQASVIAEMAEQTLLDLRALLVDLRPSSVVQRGLAEAMESLCEEWQTSHRVPVECSVMLTGRRVPATIEDVIYRVAQEALSNVAKHTHASQVHVSLVETPRKMTLSVTDNGPGFDSESASRTGKFGLLSMRERARSVGGDISIESDTARGTTIRMTLPLGIKEQDQEQQQAALS
ncbi:MAG: histidine kinase [Anaerolineae bacterium]|nr:HAMP domain-containing protein [Anaerolineae bacterium]